MSPPPAPAASPRLRAVARLSGAVLTAAAAPAAAADWSVEAAYTADVMGAVDETRRAGRFLDNLDLIADGDLGRGARVHVYLLNNSGGAPNEVVGSVQGVNNIEVARPRAKLYELWWEQTLPDPRVSVLAGFYDLNSEFYVTESSGLLVAPPFGIGSELAATGPNGPSIFPSTALAVRIKVQGESGGYLQAAALNATAGDVGDPDGPELDFDAGALLIAQGGVRRDSGSFSVGAWRYTATQPDLRDTTPSGEPAEGAARGAYVLAERVLFERDGPKVVGFLRAGVSDGDTTPFTGAWQTGLLVERVFPGRPDSQFSVGVHQGRLGAKYRANGADEGLVLGPAETGVEVTYSDTVLDNVSLQPTLQIIRRPGGDRGAEQAVVAGLRVTVAFDLSGSPAE